MKYLICFLLASVSSIVYASEAGQSRSVSMEAFTSDVIEIPYGRSVKLVFPWPLDEYDRELPYKIDLPDESVFTFLYPEGQNYIRVSYSSSGRLAGEITDMQVSSHGYHYNFVLKSVGIKDTHYALVEYRLSDGDKLEFMARERQRIMDALQEEYQSKYDDLDDMAEDKALSLLGELSQSKPNVKRVYEEGSVLDSIEDEVTIFVDKIYQYDHIYVIPFEIKNETAGVIHLTNMTYYQTNADSSDVISLTHSADYSKKIEAGETGYGYVVTNDLRYRKSLRNVIEVDTELGTMEVIW